MLRVGRGAGIAVRRSAEPHLQLIRKVRFWARTGTCRGGPTNIVLRPRSTNYFLSFCHFSPKPFGGGAGASIMTVESRARAVAIMGECMEPFAKDEVPLQGDEIKEWSDRAFAVWKAVLS
jgi:hypothetical protein